MTARQVTAVQRKPDMSSSVELLTVKIRTKIYEETGATTKAMSARLSSGQALLDLKGLIDADPSVAGGLTFWEHFDLHIASFTSRRDAERRMAMARQDDPAGALEEERRKTRERVARLRDGRSPVPAYNEDVRRDTSGSTSDAATTPIIPDDRDVGAAPDGGNATASLLVEQMKRLVLRMSREERAEAMTWWMENFDA